MRNSILNCLSCALVLASIISCTNSKKNSQSDDILNVEVNTEHENKFESMFSAPSPEELMLVFSEADLSFNAEALSDPNKVSGLIGSKVLAVNLGVYVTDAAYLNMFKQYSQMTEYLESIFEIVDKLDLGGVYQNLDFKKMFQEMNNLDSLIVLSEGVYHAITDYMTDNNNEQQLCLISYGSVVELLYIAMESLPGYKPDDPVLQQIYDQNMQLKNLIEFASQYEGVEEIDDMISNLKMINNVFDEIETDDTETVLSETEDGRLKISGGKKHKITNEQFTKLKSVVKDIREKIIA